MSSDGRSRETKATLGRMRRKRLGLRVGLTYCHIYKLLFDLKLFLLMGPGEESN